MAFSERQSEAPTATPSDFEQDLAQVRAALVRAVRRVCPAWMADCAEDLVQVALLRLVNLHRRGDGMTDFSPYYLKKVAYSVVVEEIRRRRLPRRQEVALEEERPETHPATLQPDPEQLAASGEIGQAIRKCLGRLVRPRRLAVTLHLQGHRGAETARLLGWSAKRAENLIYRGLADLRACLEARGIGR
jgi:RNA polymerase sigma-70 factor (ECF subfamily)